LSPLCGFSVSEIASAFLSRHETVKKRIARAKALLASSKHLFELGDSDFAERLSSVQRALYLLFSEGFHGSSTAAAVRAELCDEAMRLAALLCENPATATPATYALCALMFLHAARLPSRRRDEYGDARAAADPGRRAPRPYLATSAWRLVAASWSFVSLTCRLAAAW
jgi:RNA polymerase sigma-70 factor (ECF subfamily)